MSRIFFFCFESCHFRRPFFFRCVKPPLKLQRPSYSRHLILSNPCPTNLLACHVAPKIILWPYVGSPQNYAIVELHALFGWVILLVQRYLTHQIAKESLSEIWQAPNELRKKSLVLFVGFYSPFFPVCLSSSFATTAPRTCLFPSSTFSHPPWQSTCHQIFHVDHKNVNLG